MPARNRAHYQGNYNTLAKQVRQAANADPTTRCWRCGELRRAGDPWQAGHLIDGLEGGPLRAEHRSCNTRAGAQLGNKRRKPLQTTRDW